MKFLLDTHILLWAVHEPSKLNKDTQNLISDLNNIIFISAATLWELQIKKSIGKIRLPDNFSLLLEQGGYELLDIKVNHINKLNELPLTHKDPFDRMLIVQSICENIPLVTNDAEIMKYKLEGFKNIVV